jgi:N-alpha-acetyltransferase 15/16, NatA auxiliary subunit
MKGLILNQFGPTRKVEVYDLCKKGLRYDLTSHICWHVLGMVYRSDRNYEEALKCYQNAIKFDRENLNILKDMAVLQIQCRLYEPYTVYIVISITHNTGNEDEVITIEATDTAELDSVGSRA